MKITAVRGFPVKVSHRNRFVIQVETDEGVTGLGEEDTSGLELAMQGMLDLFTSAYHRPHRSGPAADRAYLADTRHIVHIKSDRQ